VCRASRGQCEARNDANVSILGGRQIDHDDLTAGRDGQQLARRRECCGLHVGLDAQPPSLVIANGAAVEESKARVRGEPEREGTPTVLVAIDVGDWDARELLVG